MHPTKIKSLFNAFVGEMYYTLPGHKYFALPTLYSIYSIILPVVLYGCETWSLTLKKEHRLEEFENRVLRRIFGPNRDEVTGEWRKLHNEEDEMGGACYTNGEKKNAYRLLVGKPEGKRQLGRLRRRRVDNIRMNLGEVGWGDVDWIGLAQDRNRWRAHMNSYVRHHLDLSNLSMYITVTIRHSPMILKPNGSVVGASF
jgi:hypothetical protein